MDVLLSISKKKILFMDTSMTFQDFGIKMEKAFYGSTHGKNGGVNPNQFSSIVIAGAIWIAFFFL
jgi:hypothetical protein